MTNTEKNLIASIVQKYCREQRFMDAATQAAADEALECGRDAKSMAAKRYYAAAQFVKQIDPAWFSLTDIDQHILDEFYGQRKQHTGAVARLGEEYGISERQVYNLSAKSRLRFLNALTKYGISKGENHDL